MLRNTVLFLASLISCTPFLSAQRTDSTTLAAKDSIFISAKTIDPLSKLALTAEIDSSMSFFHQYNPVYKQSFSPQFLGNTGAAFQDNLFHNRSFNSPLIFANPYLVYFHSPYTRLHYNTKRPYTKLSYLTAGNRQTSEQVLGALHTQNFNPYTNLGLEYDLIASRGQYLYQEVKSNRFTLFASHDKDNYSVYGNISSNRYKAQENGGLVNIPSFLSHQSNDPIAYLMNLQDASSSLKNLTVFATQSYRFQKTVTDTGTVTGDSIRTTKEKDLPFFFSHTLRYDQYSKIYKDEVSMTDTLGFYHTNYYNLNQAYDSVSCRILENSIQISGDEYKFLPGFMMGARHQFTRYGYLFPESLTFYRDTAQVDTVVPALSSKDFNNVSAYFMLIFDENSPISYQGKLEYFLAGYRQHDVLADVSIKLMTGPEQGNLTVTGMFYATEPDYFLKHYSSSHFRWNTAFPKTRNTSVFLSFRSGDGTIYALAGASLLDNYMYINSSALPAKSDLNLLVTSIRLEKAFKWGGFNHVHKMVLQKVNHDNILQLPLLAYSNTSYYENAFFKNVLKFQLGFDFYANTSYYSDAWMPATGFFYRQNSGKTGEFPFLDAFLSWKVKRTQFFLKYTNALAGMAGHNYFTTYSYPMNPPTLKFGLSWLFYD